jgi:hypothetical protein
MRPSLYYMLTTISADQQPTRFSMRFNGVHEETCSTEELCFGPDYSVLKFYT